jgi:hypothetical protein
MSGKSGKVTGKVGLSRGVGGIFGRATVHPKASGEPPTSPTGVGEVAQLNCEPYVTRLQPTVRGTPIDFSLELGPDEASYIVPNVVVPALLPTIPASQGLNSSCKDTC